MTSPGKKQIKELLGELPLAAEIYWQMRQSGKSVTKSFSLKRVEEALPEWCSQALAARQQNLFQVEAKRRVLIFATLRYWIQQATLLGIALAGMGHTVTLAYLPYANPRKHLTRFDLRRQNLYAKSVLREANPPLTTVSFLDNLSNGSASEIDKKLPKPLLDAIQQVSLRDVQYALQIEDFNQNGKDTEAGRLYKMRLERNTQAALASLVYMENNHPDVLLTPNGSILELGAVYQAARYLDFPVVTYEFGEQHQRIWLAQNAEVMHQETNDLWQARGEQPLDEMQWEKIRNLFDSRQQASLWGNFSRRWQGAPSQGASKVRTELNLNTRPTVVLAANVIGDSLTLGRQVFSLTMTEWLERTVQFFARSSNTQLVIRVHPGERYTKGPSVSEVVQRALPSLPEHIHLVAADNPINTYDLIEVADLGLVYTTTVGMEMAMSGVPVIVAGQTHYRSKGFTLDPDSWEAYFNQIERALTKPEHGRLSHEQIERAWNYAYRFFFEYPAPFPWHLHFFILKELQTWPMERVLSREGQELFGETFRYLLGESRDWSKPPVYPNQL